MPEPTTNRRRVILLSAAIVVVGAVLALQFRKAGEPEVAKQEDPKADTDSARLAATDTAEKVAPRHAPIESENLFSPRPTSKPSVSPAMSNALAEFDRTAFPHAKSPGAADTAHAESGPLATADRSPTLSDEERLEPLDSEPQLHVVADGDTLERLAERYLGRSDRQLEIYEYNRDLLSHPEVLPIGAELRIPPKIPVQPSPIPMQRRDEPVASDDDLTPLAPIDGDVSLSARPVPTTVSTSAGGASQKATSPNAAAANKPRTYEVQPGDNLVDIARKLYGDGRRHEQLFQSNRNVLKHPAALRPGMVLVVP